MDVPIPGFHFADGCFRAGRQSKFDTSEKLIEGEPGKDKMCNLSLGCEDHWQEA